MSSRKSRSGSIKTSTPVVGNAKDQALPRAGSSTSLSPVVERTTKNRLVKNSRRILSSSLSDANESKRPKSSTTSKHSPPRRDSNESWKTFSCRSTFGSTFDEDLSAPAGDCEKWKDGPYVECEELRDAPPPPTTGVECVIDALPFPRPQLRSPEIVDEDIRKDAPYVEVPTLELPDRCIDDAIFGIESDQDEEYHVKTPTKTYFGTRPLRTRSKGRSYPRTIASEDGPIFKDSGEVRWPSYLNYNAERLWNKYCAKEAEESYRASQQSAPPKRTPKFFKTEMFKSRAKNAWNWQEESAKPRRRKKKREISVPGNDKRDRRSSSPEMIRIRCEGLFGDNETCKVIEENGRTYDFFGDENPFDPNSTANQRELEEAEKEKRRRLSAICGRKRKSACSSETPVGPPSCTVTEDNGGTHDFFGGENPFDPNSTANQRELEGAEKEKRRRLSAICGRKRIRSSEIPLGPSCTVTEDNGPNTMANTNDSRKNLVSSSGCRSRSISIRSIEPFDGRVGCRNIPLD